MRAGVLSWWAGMTEGGPADQLVVRKLILGTPHWVHGFQVSQVVTRLGWRPKRVRYTLNAMIRAGVLVRTWANQAYLWHPPEDVARAQLTSDQAGRL